MKKTYIKPCMQTVAAGVDALMIASSIQNIEGDTQHGIETNDKDDFEAGGNRNDNSWNLWDE